MPRKPQFRKLSELEETYHIFRSRYFPGRKDNVEVRWVKMNTLLGKFFLYRTSQGLRPKKGDEHCCIQINPCIKFSRCLWQMTLLHEMVHWKLHGKDKGSYHGHLFQNEMKKLAAKGAFNNLW